MSIGKVLFFLVVFSLNCFASNLIREYKAQSFIVSETVSQQEALRLCESKLDAIEGNLIEGKVDIFLAECQEIVSSMMPDKILGYSANFLIRLPSNVFRLASYEIKTLHNCNEDAPTAIKNIQEAGISVINYYCDKSVFKMDYLQKISLVLSRLGKNHQYVSKGDCEISKAEASSKINSFNGKIIYSNCAQASNNSSIELEIFYVSPIKYSQKTRVIGLSKEEESCSKKSNEITGWYDREDVLPVTTSCRFGSNKIEKQLTYFHSSYDPVRENISRQYNSQNECNLNRETVVNQMQKISDIYVLSSFCSEAYSRSRFHIYYLDI